MAWSLPFFRSDQRLSVAELVEISRLLRYYILLSSTSAGSGHPTSALSAVEVMAALVFGGFFHYDLDEPSFPANDRLLFSKGHASPLFYALFAAAGKVSEQELLTFRQFGSRLEGHPTLQFPYTEVPTGSLGQGLSVGVGYALAAQYLDQRTFKTYVLLGDSEMSEGSVWEAIQVAAHYKLRNLVGIIDLNRLGQRGETMVGHDAEMMAKRVAAFGWRTEIVDGHDLPSVLRLYEEVLRDQRQPIMIIAKTIKGKGVAQWENQDGWHSKTLSKDQFAEAVRGLGPLSLVQRAIVPKPVMAPHVSHSAAMVDKAPHSSSTVLDPSPVEVPELDFSEQKVPTKKAYGLALAHVGSRDTSVVVLDAEMSNSTHADIFQRYFPERFFEMFIAEQNMVGVGVGLAKTGKRPALSTFAAFFTRAFDQLRMAAYSEVNLTICGSYGGVSLGMDGISQMGLEDLAMMRSLWNSTVLYPSDAWSMVRAVELSLKQPGITYIRATREPTSLIYQKSDVFQVGGSRVLKQSSRDLVTLVGAGITLHECVVAAQELEEIGITCRVIDLFSVKPLDQETLSQAARETQVILTVEDHYPQGGMGEAVASCLSTQGTPVLSLAVDKMPRSGKPYELLEYEHISSAAIVSKVLQVVGGL